jgi:glutathione synthase/RimK-type ligase-like ATP-grasp enzyme
MVEHMKTALIVTSFAHSEQSHNTTFVTQLNDALETGSGHRAVQGALKEFTFRISNHDISVHDHASDKDIAEYDLVLFMLWENQPDVALAAAHYLKIKQVPFYDSELLTSRRDSKLLDAVTLAEAKLPVPKSVYARSSRLLALCEAGQLDIDFPFILKDIHGRKGRLNFLVQDLAHLHGALEQHPDTRFIIQEFIPNNGDYRFLVLGDKVRLVIYRSRTDPQSHLNNISQGAKGDLLPVESFDNSVLDMAVAAAKVTERQLAGVDIMFDRTTNKPYILEVNSQPEMTSGFVEHKIEALARFLELELK